MTTKEIITRQSPQILYVAFDVVPAPKGAAIHIEQFVHALSRDLGEVHLVTVSPDEEIHGPRKVQPNLIHTQLPAAGKDLVSRVLHFRRLLDCLLKNRAKPFDIIHFRSPLEGYWLAVNKNQLCRFLVYEVNGLHSIELKYRYEALREDLHLLDKIEQQEQACLNAADLIVTPSSVTREHLLGRSVESERIAVIRNGVDLDKFSYSPPRRLRDGTVLEAVYFGTLSHWQGVDSAIRAVALSKRPTRLKLVSAGKRAHIKAIQKLIDKLDLAQRVSFLPPCSQDELVSIVHQSHVVLAPLALLDRNTIQGCCPLKVIEGMAAGTPVITSDLPVTRELSAGTSCLFFAKAGSDRQLAENMDTMYDDFDALTSSSRVARSVVEDRHTWQRAGAELVGVYQLLGSAGFTRARSPRSP